MKVATGNDRRWSAVSEFVAAQTGLDFPAERHEDLRRSFAAAARSLGMEGGADACADLLLSGAATPVQLQHVLNQLTIGETYFLRDKQTFQALREHLLPELIARRSSARELRVWSAACCTGEELYTLAILLRQSLPDWHRWRLLLLGTDINEGYLKRATAGVYADWSFRDVPEDFKYLWFTRGKDGRYAIVPELRRGLKFAKQNLIAPKYRPELSDGRPFDLILCRNVLMYFRTPRALEVVAKLRDRLADDGWLLVGASEGNHYLRSGFAAVCFPGAILYKKQSPDLPRVDTAGPAAAAQPSMSSAAPPEQSSRASAGAEPIVPEQLAFLVRNHANQGNLQEALRWCDRWIDTATLDGSAYYLRGTILQELGRVAEARYAFARALYLQPEMALADVALGSLARKEGRSREAERHLRNALLSLSRMPADAILADSDGLSVQRLREMVESILMSRQVAS